MSHLLRFSACQQIPSPTKVNVKSVRALYGASLIGFAVEDLDAEYKRLSDRGVKFIEPPKKQYWGGYAALFADPDENLFYLVEVKNEA